MSTRGHASPAARVTISSHSLARLRVSLQLTRWLFYALAIAGLLATLRFAIAPPQPSVPRTVVPPRADLAAAGFAQLFARRYLTWDASRPDAYAQALAPFLGDGLDANAGLRLPAAGAQTVAWADVVQVRNVSASEHVYTVAAQVSPDALVYLSVDVIRDSRGLSLGRYPAFVGPPASHAATALSSGSLQDVADPGLARVVERTLRNYLADSTSNLAADLAAGARVAAPPTPLSLRSVTQLQWRADHGGVIATVAADDGRGTGYALSYELDVVTAAGRWEVAAIQADPET